MADRAWMRTVWSKVCTAILRGIVDRAVDGEGFPLLQVKWLGDRVSADVEYKQPQGIFFLPKTGSEGLFLSVGGTTSSGVYALAQDRSDTPGGAGIGEGEGGLYYAGEFKVFLDSSGLVHLGAKAGSEFVALADKVKTELDGIKSDLDAVKSSVDAHSHTVPITGPSGTTSTTPPLAPMVLTYSPTTPAATKVKAT